MNATVGLYTFQDVDLFREVLRGWDVEPTQLSSGRLLVRWDQLTLDDLTISRLRTNRRVADRTAYQAGHVGFVVCLGSKTFCGRPVNAGSLVLFGPGREYRNLLEENWESFEISMTSELFRSLSFANEVAHRITMGPEYSVLPLSPHLISSFRAWAASFLTPFRDDSSLVEEICWTGAVRERTVGLLARVFHENECVSLETHRSSEVQGWSLAVRALDYIDHHQHESLTIPQISQAMGCTSRSLQLAFQKALQIAPSQYILARRLHEVRSDLLLRTNGAPVVTRAAANRGFLSFGRFAQHYQRLFGELPSATVLRARRRPVL